MDTIRPRAITATPIQKSMPTPCSLEPPGRTARGGPSAVPRPPADRARTGYALSLAKLNLDPTQTWGEPAGLGLSAQSRMAAGQLFSGVPDEIVGPAPGPGLGCVHLLDGGLARCSQVFVNHVGHRVHDLGEAEPSGVECGHALLVRGVVHRRVGGAGGDRKSTR